LDYAWQRGTQNIDEKIKNVKVGFGVPVGVTPIERDDIAKQCVNTVCIVKGHIEDKDYFPLPFAPMALRVSKLFKERVCDVELHAGNAMYQYSNSEILSDGFSSSLASVECINAPSKSSLVKLGSDELSNILGMQVTPRTRENESRIKKSMKRLNNQSAPETKSLKKENYSEAKSNWTMTVASAASPLLDHIYRDTGKVNSSSSASPKISLGKLDSQTVSDEERKTIEQKVSMESMGTRTLTPESFLDFIGEIDDDDLGLLRITLDRFLKDTKSKSLIKKFSSIKVGAGITAIAASAQVLEGKKAWLIWLVNGEWNGADTAEHAVVAQTFECEIDGMAALAVFYQY